LPRVGDTAIVSCGHILVVDDDAPIRELVSELLARAGLETRAAESGAEALALAREERPDLVVLDVQLRDMSGYAVCRELRESFGDELPIMFVSGSRTESFDRVGGLLLGADDYLVKPFTIGELIARVRRAIDRSSRQVPAADGTLTDREREVLGLLADGHSQTAIAEQLFITPKTVATHIQHILAKLDLHSRAEAVAFAHRHGL
jgi:two-component system, OmpR family, response regulator